MQLGKLWLLLTNALHEDAISEETRFQLNMLALIAATPQLATLSKKLDTMITDLDNKINANARLSEASKNVLNQHLDNISKKLSPNSIKDKELEQKIEDLIIKIKKNRPNCI